MSTIQVSTAFAIHFFQAVPKSVALPAIEISGNAKTSKNIPTSLTISPITPMIVNVQKYFLDDILICSRVRLNTNTTEKIQLNTSPTQKPSATEMLNPTVAKIPSCGKHNGINQASNSQKVR